MRKFRSTGFFVAAILAAGTTTLLCFDDALSLVPCQSANSMSAAAPAGMTASPLDLLHRSSSWLTPVPGGVQALRGKVVLVNFWTYSCINSLRALPYLRAWSDRYGDKGLVVVGIHTPEFDFEKDAAKVRLASAQLDVRYPNLQDNHYALWREFGNEGWPGFYFIDAKGRIRGYRLGEGNYADAEQLIRKLLAETGHDPSDVPISPIKGTGIEAEAAWSDLRSPEAYVGFKKAVKFASPGGLVKNVETTYTTPRDLSLNQWALAGRWTVGPEFAALGGAGGAITFRFHARDLHLVLGGAADRRPVRFRVTIDGAPPGANHGSDVDESGWGELQEDRLYQLVRQPDQVVDRTVRVEFHQGGVRAYVFTFG
ncbi:redoxin domain-containing protein [Edaphosphingomonas haloaromaticamans]|uniref:Thiol-disulfide oxidoreductase YkuV n=1 Tax=Edaphosphingomonas haloaromaticamans TaxID=653954 RepID=A0A1S1HEP6_9SPHN|nr:redoxin domain-containing protein [Sphingomonas haloaromaticamans]OHT20587.1 Thiol-disulfide oxidoreductase YkuV [Sphingomonas haloaromaticamans]